MTLTRLANSMIVPASPSATNPSLTPVISMGDDNALNLQITVLSGGGAGNTLQANIMGSDDLENWLTTGLSSSTITQTNAAVGTVFSGQITSFGYAYARIAFSWALGGAATLIAVDANTYKN